MGELASLLSEVAEALAGYPDEILIMDGDKASADASLHRDSIVVNAREWPSIQEIEQLIANWRALRLIESGAGVSPAVRRAGV